MKDQTGYLFHPGDGDCKDKYNNSPLFYACKNLNKQFVDYLVNELKVNIN